MGGMKSHTFGLALALGVLCIFCASCTYRPASFDLVAARRAGDLAADEVIASRKVIEGVHFFEVRFTSAAWDKGAAHPIRIQAYVAVPPGDYAAHSKPAVVYAHGLGGQADANTVVQLCRNLDVVALSLSGPGLGASEGLAVTPEDPRALFAASPDVRQSWLYTYVYAILRAITYLQTRSEVDPQAIALTGFSLGGLATFVANGVDDRIRVAVPVAAAGDLMQAATADTWLRALILSGHLQPRDAGPQAFFRAFDPLAYARRQKGAVYMMIGAQDEYFPLEQAVRTYAALRAQQKGLALLADYDHGWYFGGGCPARCMPGQPRAADCPDASICPKDCPAGAEPPYCGPQASYNREADFSARWALLLRALVAQYVAQPPRPFAPPLATPVLERRAGEVTVRTQPEARGVRLAISTDCGYTYSQIKLQKSADGVYRHVQAVADNAILIAEVENADEVVTTSLPVWPKSCRLHVRPFGPRPKSSSEK